MRENISSIKNLVAGVIENRENSNDLVYLIDLISTSDDVELVKEVVQGIVEIFKHVFSKGDIGLNDANNTDSEIPTEIAYRSWMKERFEDAYNEILKTIPNKEPEFQQFAVEQILNLIQYESKAVIVNSTPDVHPFPEKHLSSLIRLLLLLENLDLAKLFSTCLCFDDFRFYSFKLMPALITEIINNRPSQEKMNFLFSFLKLISNYVSTEIIDITTCKLFSLENTELDEADTVLQNLEKSKVMYLPQHQKLFGAMWLEFLKVPLSGSLHKQVLMIIHSHLIPNFRKARLLSDFLIKSYSRGGGLALLGLQGLFSLMQEHNLEYPDFYLNLYGMLHPRIFEEKYASRFFYLLNLFLSSTHISSYLVAAFIKKLARLCLIGPPNGTLVMVKLVINLLIRHPSTQTLIHVSPKKNGSLSPQQDDPFLDSEKDPAKCKAMESSLWELKALENHYCPSVAQCATITKLGSLETDLGPALDTNSKEIFDEYASKSTENCAMNYETPMSLFTSFEDHCQDIWNV